MWKLEHWNLVKPDKPTYTFTLKDSDITRLVGDGRTGIFGLWIIINEPDLVVYISNDGRIQYVSIARKVS